MRKCSDCGNPYPLDAKHFYRRGEGLQNICKKCHDLRVKGWRKNQIMSGKLNVHLRACNFVDKELAEEIFRLPELRKLEVPSELAERILSLPDSRPPAKLARMCKCDVDTVKSVLLNEQRWREELGREAVG